LTIIAFVLFVCGSLVGAEILWLIQQGLKVRKEMKDMENFK
jgi:hypothetical protein